MDSRKAAARRAGLLYFVFMLAGIFGEFVLPSFTVPGDAAATAAGIAADPLTYRLAILTGLATHVIFIFLVALLYGLFRDTDRTSALLMVLLVAVGVALALANMLSKLLPLAILGGTDYLSAFTQPQLDALALASLRLHGQGAALVTAFWGLWLFPFGALVIKSGFIPRIFGYLLLAAGFAYLATSVVALVLPDHRPLVWKIMMPLFFGEVPVIFWLLIKGARPPRPAGAAADLG